LKVSFIVSAYDRPKHLACVLQSLLLQTEQDFEIMVTDNGKAFTGAHRATCEDASSTIRYENPMLTDCYTSANWGATQAKGDYLCFPSDDGYYVPRFLETMLRAAPADLIFCDCVFDGHGRVYAHEVIRPEVDHIDKGGFLIRREVFPGFNGAPVGPCAADGWMIEQVVKSGASLAKVPGILWVHN